MNRVRQRSWWQMHGGLVQGYTTNGAGQPRGYGPHHPWLCSSVALGMTCPYRFRARMTEIDQHCPCNVRSFYFCAGGQRDLGSLLERSLVRRGLDRSVDSRRGHHRVTSRSQDPLHCGHLAGQPVDQRHFWIAIHIGLESICSVVVADSDGCSAH
jgi:hypothetical protein